MTRLIVKATLFLLLLVLALPVWAQSSEPLDSSYDVLLASVEIPHPTGWASEDLSDGGGSNIRIYEIDFDRTSGQQPRGVIIQAKPYKKLEGETLENAFTTLADLNDQSGLESTLVEGTQLDMLRGDTTMVGNVGLGVIVIDASEEFWLYLQIMNTNKPIVDTILANIAPISENTASEEPIQDESEADTTSETDETVTAIDGAYSVVITAVGERKIDVIKAIRGLTELGLADAKTLAETEPEATVLTDVTLEVAESAKVELETAGATVEIRGGDMANDMGCGMAIQVMDADGALIVSIEASEQFDFTPMMLEDSTLSIIQNGEMTAIDGGTLTVKSAECANEMANTDALYDVVITVVGDQKINVIKAVRTLTGFGLVEAKDVVEAAPDGVVLSGVTYEVAESAKTDLEMNGATVTLVELP